MYMQFMVGQFVLQVKEALGLIKSQYLQEDGLLYGLESTNFKDLSSLV